MGDTSVNFVVEGPPKPLARPVLGRAPGRLGRAWLRNPTSNNIAKQRVRDAVRAQVFEPRNRQPTILFGSNVPIVVDITFHMVPPLSLFVNGDREGGRFKAISSSKWPTAKPDLDNLDKLVLDSLQGFLIHEDKQVVRQCICKTYDRQAPYTGRTEVSVRLASQEQATSHSVII